MVVSLNLFTNQTVHWRKYILGTKRNFKMYWINVFREEKSEALAEMKDELEHNRTQLAKLKTEVSCSYFSQAVKLKCM